MPTDDRERQGNYDWQNRVPVEIGRIVASESVYWFSHQSLYGPTGVDELILPKSMEISNISLNKAPYLVDVGSPGFRCQTLGPHSAQNRDVSITHFFYSLRRYRMSNSQDSPIDALEQSKSEALEQMKLQLQADHAEQNAQLRAQHAEDARLQDRFRNILFGHLSSKEVELKQLAEDQRRLIEERAKLIRRPLLMKGKLPIPRSPANTASVLKVAPFDFTWTSSGQGSASANKDTGVYNLSVQSIGSGTRSVGAGIGFWFSSDAVGNTGQRFAAYIAFTEDYHETAMGYTAYSKVRTWLTVWGMSERGWVASSGDQTPSWAYGVSWGDSHGVYQSGGSNLVTAFNAQPNSLYACWVQSSAEVNADHGTFGFADSTIHLDIQLSSATFD